MYMNTSRLYLRTSDGLRPKKTTVVPQTHTIAPPSGPCIVTLGTRVEEDQTRQNLHDCSGFDENRIISRNDITLSTIVVLRHPKRGRTTWWLSRVYDVRAASITLMCCFDMFSFCSGLDLKWPHWYGSWMWFFFRLIIWSKIPFILTEIVCGSWGILY